MAGGRSRRMGRDKAFLKWEGQALWGFQWEKLQSLGASEGLISVGENRRFPESEDYRQVIDSESGLGPLGGLVACLKAAQSSWLLVLAVDMPAMKPAFLSELLDRIQKGGAKGVVPRIGSYWEPLAAVYPTDILECASERLRSNDRSLQGFVKASIEKGQLESWPVSKEQEALFQNLNSPDDL